MGFKDSIYWRIYSDVWGLHKKYAGVQESSEYWDGVVESSELVYKKYKCKPEGEFAKQLLLCVVNELERRYKCVKGGGG